MQNKKKLNEITLQETALNICQLLKGSPAGVVDLKQQLNALQTADSNQSKQAQMNLNGLNWLETSLNKLKKLILKWTLNVLWHAMTGALKQLWNPKTKSNDKVQSATCLPRSKESEGLSSKKLQIDESKSKTTSIQETSNPRCNHHCNQCSNPIVAQTHHGWAQEAEDRWRIAEKQAESLNVAMILKHLFNPASRHECLKHYLINSSNSSFATYSMQTETTLPKKSGLECHLQWAELLKKASNPGRSQRGPVLKGCWTQPWIQLKKPHQPTTTTTNKQTNKRDKGKKTKEERKAGRTHSTPSFSQSRATESNWACKFLTVSSWSASTTSSTSTDSDSPPSSTSWKAARVLKFGKSRLLLKIPPGKAGKIAVESKLPELLSSSLSMVGSGNSCRLKWLWITLKGFFESPNPLWRHSPEISCEPAGAKATCQPETVQEFFWKLCTGMFLNWNLKPAHSTTLHVSFLKRYRRAPMRSKA